MFHDHPVWTALGLIEIVYVLALSAWIILQRRAPAATLAWIFGMALVPVGGFVVYHFLGPRKLLRSRLKRLRARQALGSIKERVAAVPEGRLHTVKLAAQLARIGTSTTMSGVCGADDVRVLPSGKSTFEAMLADIRAAKHHVHVLYYIFEPDQTGRALLDALAERARAGVEVRLLVDAVGSARLRKRVTQALRDAGGEVAYFNRASLVRRGRRLNFRNHRKICVIDGRVGYTGGVNVHDEEDSSVRADAWRDTHVRLEGGCVAGLQLVFLEDWHYTKGKAPSGKEYIPESQVPSSGALVQILDSGPDTEFEIIKLTYFAALGVATERVWLTAAYFVPDESMLVALKAAALRGVDVRLLVSKKSDSRVVSAAARSYFPELLRAGVRIHEYEPVMLHSKTLLVDDWFSAIGTANMDNRSFRLNFEVTAVIYDPKTNTELATLFDQDLAQATEITPRDLAQAPLSRRLFESTARLLSPLL
jgi:cardiolipin synthase